MQRWAAGQVIEQRDRDWRGDLTTVRKVTVVSDDSDRLILFGAAGDRYQSRAMLGRYGKAVDERIAYFASDKRGFPLESRFSDWSVLTINPWRGHSSVWVFWKPDGTFHGWYVNFQRPLRRDVDAITVVDWFLDIFVRPDGSWETKDRDEFDAACRAGLLTRYERRACIQEHRRMSAVVDKWERPFDEGWESWLQRRLDDSASPRRERTIDSAR
jgi:hypothetical protein